MGNVKSDNKEKLSITVMIFCIVGVVLTVLGFLLVKNNNFKIMIIGTEGTVVSVQTSTNAQDDLVLRNVVVSYKGTGDDYSASVVNDDLQIGDKMTLYYDVLSPENVSTKRAGYQGYLCLIIGIVLVLKTGPRFYRIIRDNYL